MANDTTLDKVVIEFDGKVNNFDASIDTLIEEIKGLRQELKDMSKDTENAGDDIDEATESIEDMDDSVENLSKSLSSTKKTFAVFAGMTRSIMKFTEMSTQAVGVQTRFNSVFGSTKEELKGAKTWVDEYSDSLYLDSAEVMDAASTFKLLAGNIGLANEEADIMSEGLTKLSYDLMALRGENDASMAQTALMSAMGGEAEAMKRYGVMLNQATLQQTLYALGIDRTVASLNAAERAQLIYYQIMNTTAGQQGYYAKTLMSPANALNIIKTQFTLLAREIGNVFIPILMELLPVVIAVTRVLRELAQWLAGIFKIDIDFDYVTSGIGNITGGIGDIGNEADKTAAKVKNMTRDFDKLHVVNFDTGSGSGSGQTGGIGGSGFGNAIDLTPYKEWNAELDKSKEKVEKIKNFLDENKNILLAILGTLAVAKVAPGVMNFFSTLIGLAKSGIVGVIAGVSFAISGIEQFSQGIQIDDARSKVSGILQTALGVGLATWNLAPPGTKFIATAIAIIGTTLVMSIIDVITDKDNGLNDWQKNVQKQYNKSQEVINNPTSEESRKYVAERFRMNKESGVSIPQEYYDALEAQMKEDGIGNENLLTIWQTQGYEAMRQAQAEYSQARGEYIEELTKNPLDNLILRSFPKLGSTVGNFEKTFISSIKSVTKGNGEFEKSVEKTTNNNIKAYDFLKMSSLEQTKAILKMSGQISNSDKEVVVATKAMVQGVTSEYKSMQVVGTETMTTLKTSVIQNAKLLEQGGVASVKTFVNNSLNNMKKMQITGSGDMTTLTADTIATLKELQRSGNPEVAEFATASLNEIKNMTSMVKKDTDDMQKTTVNKFTGLGNKIIKTFDDARPKISDSLEKIKNLTKFEWSLPSLKVPHFQVTKAISNIGSILGEIVMPEIKVSFFETGGFPDTGSLFVANEREPELIGNWGNKSMVANSTQIIKGIESASYNGMKRALTEVPMSNETNVYVGNKQLTDVVTKQQRINNNKYGR